MSNSELLNTLVEDIVTLKKTDFTKDEIRKYAIDTISPEEIWCKQSHLYSPRWERPIILGAFIEHAEKLSGKSVPDNPYQAVKFVEDYLTLVRIPKTNVHWYPFELRRNLTDHVVRRFESTFLSDVTLIVRTLDNTLSRDSISNSLCRSLERQLPQFSISPEHLLFVAKELYDIRENKYKINELIESYCLKSKDRTNRIYSLIKSESNKDNISPFLNIVLRCLSHFDFERAFKDADELLSKSAFELLRLNTLGWFHFTTEDQIYTVFQKIVNHKKRDEDYDLHLPRIFINLISQSVCSTALKIEIMTELCVLSLEGSAKVCSELSQIVGYIKEFEEEKTKILHNLLLRQTNVDFGIYFSEYTNPSPLFRLIKDMYGTVGLKASIKPFLSALTQLCANNTADFEKEALDLISHNLGIYRKAGLDILFADRFFTCEINILKLDEGRQLILLDTLQDYPGIIEKRVEHIITLIRTEYSSVREAVKKVMLHLVYSFEDYSIQLLEGKLDSSSPYEMKVLSDIKKTWEEYEQIIQMKKNLLEFDPFQNQYFYTDLYYRLEEEKNVEQMEEGLQSNIMVATGAATTFPILRGSGFNFEKNPRISQLNNIGSKTYIDKRYFMNPDNKSWEFQNQFYSKNYKEEE